MYEEEVFKLIAIMRLSLDNPLPKTPHQRKKIKAARKALDTAELAIKIGKSAAAFFYGIEYQSLIYKANSEEALRAHKHLGGYNPGLEEQKTKWFIKAFELREENPAIAATEMARIIEPQMERSVRRFISQCEKEGTLPRKLAK
jgi:hypothetical protein